MKRIGALLLLTFAISCSNKDNVDKLNFLKRGNMAYQEQNYAAAIRYYDEALAIDSAFVDALNNRGLAEMAQGLNDEAIYSFNTAIQLKPDYAEAQLNYIKANLAVGQYYASLDGLESLAKLWPDSSIIFFTRGLVYHEMKEDDKAMSSFKEALALDPTNIEITVNIANIEYHNKNYEKAIELLKTAIAKDANNAQSYNVLAMCYAGMNDYETAAGIIATAVSLDREDAYILNNQGFIALRLNNQAEAEKLFIQSMKRDPYNGWVYRNLGLLRLAEGNEAEAERMLSRAYTIDPAIDGLQQVYLNLLIKRENFPKACEIINNDQELLKQYAGILENC